MFKKYKCGCIGYVTNAMATEPGAKRVHMFRACDGDDEPYHIVARNSLQDTPSRKLTDAEVEELFGQLSALVADGYALRDLRHAMRRAGMAS